MKLDLAGKLRNTNLSRSNCLLPLFEAIVNSFQAIEEEESKDSALIEISVIREKVFDGIKLGDVIGFSITDNGTGFTEKNYNSFLTSDSLHKQERGGKGLGRFLWLKAFDKVDINSIFSELVDGKYKWYRRSFSFSPRDIQNHAISELLPTNKLTTVNLIGFKNPYREASPKELEVIGYRIFEHCLPYFLDPNCPKVIIKDEETKIDLISVFTNKYRSSSSMHQFAIDGNGFQLRGIKIQGSKHTQHKLLFAANFREVRSERLDRIIPNLQKRLKDESGGSFSYLGFVSGQYLDQNVSTDRTQFLFPDKSPSLEEQLLIAEPSLSDIIERSAKLVRLDLKDYIEEINREKIASMSEFIKQKAPEYRVLLPMLDTIADQIKPTFSEHDLDLALHDALSNSRRVLKEEGVKIISQYGNEQDFSDYHSRLIRFLEDWNDFGKADLAQYIIHRKVVLNILQKALETDDKTGKYNLEKVIHNLIFPKGKTSDDIDYESHNLWIIDERLCYHQYLASDKGLKTVPNHKINSDLRPDLLIFDQAYSYRETTDPLTSIIVVEFKRPGRDDYQMNDNPIDQVLNMIIEIKKGTFTNDHGRHVIIQSETIPAFAYIVCDITPSLISILKKYDFRKTPDGAGYNSYRSELQTYIELIPFTKLVADSTKRNAILFNKLGLPV